MPWPSPQSSECHPNSASGKHLLGPLPTGRHSNLGSFQRVFYCTVLGEVDGNHHLLRAGIAEVVAVGNTSGDSGDPAVLFEPRQRAGRVVLFGSLAM